MESSYPQSPHCVSIWTRGGPLSSLETLLLAQPPLSPEGRGQDAKWPALTPAVGQALPAMMSLFRFLAVGITGCLYPPGSSSPS